MVLLQFKDANTADSFYANYNDRPVGLRRAGGAPVADGATPCCSAKSLKI